jgi:copper chaperone NosL
MTATLFQVLGPRTPPAELRAHPGRYLAPTLVLALAAACLFSTMFLPVWSMTLKAPQYPKGLTVTAHVDRLTGDVREIDGLNHYIGMRPLHEAGKLERDVAVQSIAALALLCLSAIVVHTRWAALLAAPAFSFPFVFLADLYYWMRDSGLHLDPKAPLSSSIKPFVPPVVGEGVIGQFRTVASVEAGWLLALLASALILVGLYLHRRAYKPLVERALAPRAPEASHAAL